MNDKDHAAADLGRPEDYVDWPAPITLQGAPYWLVRFGDGDFRLLSAVCPHAGGEIREYEELFLCPLHFWTFSQMDGVCTNMPDERLMQRLVEKRED